MESSQFGETYLFNAEIMAVIHQGFNDGPPTRRSATTVVYERPTNGGSLVCTSTVYSSLLTFSTGIP